MSLREGEFVCWEINVPSEKLFLDVIASGPDTNGADAQRLPTHLADDRLWGDAQA